MRSRVFEQEPKKSGQVKGLPHRGDGEPEQIAPGKVLQTINKKSYLRTFSFMSPGKYQTGSPDKPQVIETVHKSPIKVNVVFDHVSP